VLDPLVLLLGLGFLAGWLAGVACTLMVLAILTKQRPPPPPPPPAPPPPRTRTMWGD
jgi:hypothetical protein